MPGIFKKRKSHSFIFSVMVRILIIVTLNSVIFTAILTHSRTKDYLELADTKLLMAAELAKEITGPGFHDKIYNRSSISEEEYKSIVEKNDDICRRFNLQYIWSVLSVDRRLVFTSATHSDLNDPGSSCAYFFEEHSNPEFFSSALTSEMKPSFSSFKNKWGEGRCVLIPGKDALGRTYFFGASIKMSEFKKMTFFTIVESILIGIAVVCIAFFFALPIAGKITDPVKRLTGDALRMAEGILNVPVKHDGIKEMQTLSLSLDKMRNDLMRNIEKIRENEQKYRLLYEAAGVGVGYYTTDGMIISFNRLAALYMNGKPEDFEGKSVYDVYSREEADQYSERIKRAQLSDTPLEFEDMVSSAAGDKWFHFVYTPIVNPVSCVTGIQVIFHDITMYKLLQQENENLIKWKELLLQEVHHRIKNNMNTITGLLSLQSSAEKNSSAAASLKDAESRVNTMLILYDKLYSRENYRELSVRDYLQTLIGETVFTFPGSEKIGIETDIEDTILNVGILAPVGLIVNELITNAVKHAFADRDSGLITVSVRFNGKHAEVTVQDDGTGIPDSINPEKPAGFGLDLVAMIAEQIGGTIRIERAGGTKVTLEFNL